MDLFNTPTLLLRWKLLATSPSLSVMVECPATSVLVDAAVMFCCTCHKFMCTTGQYCHNRVPTLSHHSTVKLDKEVATVLPTLMKPTEPCCSQPGHKKLELDFYCETCKCSICRYCITAHHKGHSISEMSAAAEARRDEMKGSLQCVQEVAPTLASAISANVKMVERLEISKQEAEVAIVKAFEQLSEALDQRKKALLSDLEAVLLSKTLSLMLQKEQLEWLQQNIGHCTEVTCHTLQTHTDHELVSLGELIPAELNTTLKKVEAMSLTPNQRTFFTVLTQANPVVKELSKFGELVDLTPAPSKSICTFRSVTMVNTQYHVNVEARTFSEEWYPCGSLQVAAELRPK